MRPGFFSFVILLLAGCIDHPNDGASVAPVDEATLRTLDPLLTDGSSTLREIEERIGGPTGQFAGGRVRTYRLMKRETAFEVVGREEVENDPRLTWWEYAGFSLVLVFDEAGVLVRHQLVKVR